MTQVDFRLPATNAWWASGRIAAEGAVASYAELPTHANEETRTIRLAICKAHVGDCCSVGPDGRHYCGCCGCPRWHAMGVGSELEFKTGRAGCGCPRGEYDVRP